MRRASRERREQEKLELRETILQAAADLFMEQGYDRFSLRQVAERIGYSATTIYLYFQNKDDLLFQVCYEAFQRFSELLLAVLDGPGTPSDRLRAAGEAYVDFGLTNPSFYHMMFVERTDFLLWEQVHEQGKPLDVLGRLVAVVQEAIDAGEFKPGNAVAFADAMWAGVHGIIGILKCIPDLDDERLRQGIRATLDMVFDGLRMREE